MNPPRALTGGFALACALLLAVAWPGLAAEAAPRNIIVMVCDGCGYNHLAAASLYCSGRPGRQPYQRFPVRYAVSTHSVAGGYDPARAWSEFGYVLLGATDSAAAATAMSTGHKTYDGAVGVGLDGGPLRHALELAEERGKATGLVTSVPISHATPASFVAHHGHRDDFETIARQMLLESAVEVIMGGGHPWFDDSGLPRTVPCYQYVGGKSVWEALLLGAAGSDADAGGRCDPWALVQTEAGFAALMSGPTPRRVLGLAPVARTLQQARAGDPCAAPYAVPVVEGVPTLAQMTTAALNVLDDAPQGLFLVVEGGAIDWASHANQDGRMIEEMIDFDRAVEAAIRWVEEKGGWGETLVIVTADHETGCLWGPGSGPGSQPPWRPLEGRGRGRLPAMKWLSINHTNSLVPLFAQGCGAALFHAHATGSDPVRGPCLDNTAVGKVLRELLSPPEAAIDSSQPPARCAIP